jgi:hypothetical protein
MRDTSDALVTVSGTDLSVVTAWRAVDVWLEGVRLNGQHLWLPRSEAALVLRENGRAADRMDPGARQRICIVPA